MDIHTKNKSIYVSALILFCVLLTLLIFYNNAYGFHQPYPSLFNSKDIKNNLENSKKIITAKAQSTTNILLLGVDENKSKNSSAWQGRTDFMMILSVNPASEKLIALSIPRDTQLDKEIFGFSRINSANSIGGIDAAKSTVEKLLGIKIDNYLLVNIEGFKKIMNLFGDMKIYVPKNMKYEDHKAGLSIDFKPGLEKMNSEKMMEFLRYRDSEDGDIGRIKRQLIFFRAFIHNLKFNEILVRLPYLLDQSNNFFLTDLKEDEAIQLTKSFVKIADKSFESFILPGDFAKDGYWKIDYPDMNRLLEYIKQTS
ncbi:MAG: LytR family transcriptional regulator [Proteobacteria bacterium]|nr:LytR family transcriptional regulator [Pseudomonadota bacterium]